MQPFAWFEKETYPRTHKFIKLEDTDVNWKLTNKNNTKANTFAHIHSSGRYMDGNFNTKKYKIRTRPHTNQTHYQAHNR
jgi:hypothetical protein